MDSALLLLWWLRLKAFFRRWGKNLRSVKGIGLTVIGLLFLIPWIFSIFFFPQVPPVINVTVVRRFGPLVLLAYAFLSIIFSTGEQSLFFSPAEIAFLFPGPFSRKAILRYKVFGLVLGCLFSSLFIVMAFGRVSGNVLRSYLAIPLALLFFQFLAMAINLASNTMGALAHNARRRIGLALLLGLVLATVVPAGLSLLKLPPVEAIERLEASPVLQLATVPFRPFVLVLTADRILPDLIVWVTVCLALVGGMLTLVFAIDAQYLETAASSSAKLYDRLQRMRRGGLGATVARPRNTKLRIGMLPWWGGVGPILWRQLSTAARDPLRVGLIFLAVLMPGAAILFGMRDHPERVRDSLYFAQGFTLYLSIFLSPLVAFDFRGDVDRMDQLKTLPTPPAAIVIGQVLTPVLIFTIPQSVGFGASVLWLGGISLENWAAPALAVPATFLIFGIENLLFLLFPTRTTVASPADFAAFGRQILLMLTKFFSVVLTLGASALVGFTAFTLLGIGRVAAMVVTLGCAIGFASLLVPLMVFAFLRYDVARDSPA